ncbi:MAG TPA: plasmid stabilization protein [Gammaproteobacteria bacterium]|nr:plasmid stabilization protein [Gammaproteobacteria bacterium]
MATLTIRNLDDGTKARLRVEAALHSQSMEEEARSILRTTLSKRQLHSGLGTQIHQHFRSTVTADLKLPERKENPRAADIK